MKRTFLRKDMLLSSNYFFLGNNCIFYKLFTFINYLSLYLYVRHILDDL